MFCDLIDSSSLAEELGPEDYREVVRVVHASSATIVEHFGGQVSQYLGDGVLVLFGYPYAHEDDAAGAVNAALAVQAAMPVCTALLRKRVSRFTRSLHSRAAIDTGLVVITEMGIGPQRSVLAVGDAVNIASRLQDLAASDTLLISASTRRLLGERFELEPQGQSSIRGIRTPVETFRVSGVRPASTRHDAARRGERTPFVGREDQLAHLIDRWEKVVEGHGQAVILSGDAGIGKSRLLAAARHRISAENRWFEFRGSEYQQSSELRPVLELLESRVLEGTTGLDARRRLERALDDPGGEAVRLLAPLLSLPQMQDESPIMLLPDHQRRRILDALVAWVWRLAADSPIVIVFEDLQWVDPTTIDLLRTLVTTLRDRRVFLVLTSRTPFEPPWDPQPHELRLVLNPLTRVEAQRLVESIAEDRTPPVDVMRDVLAKSDGVPLFLEEVTLMLIDSHATMEPVPESLRELLSARLDRLPPYAQETTRIGAVVGRYFSRELLLAISRKGEEAVDKDLAVLLESGVMLSEGDGYSFKHVLLRDAAYDRMLHATRADLHGKVASTLLERFQHLAETQPELVAHHFTEAGETEPAVREWSRAGARSLRNGAYFEAMHHFQRALGLHEQLPRTEGLRIAHTLGELGLRKDLGVCLIATQGFTSPNVAKNYERALRGSSELNEREEDIPINVLYGLWGTCLVRGDRDATDELAKHFQRLTGSKDPLACHVACATLGVRAFYRGEFALAMEHCQKAMQLYEPAQHFVLMRDYGYEGGIYAQSYAACILCFTGYPDRGLALMDQVLDLSNSIGDPYTRAVALSFAASIARERSEPGKVKTLSEEMLELATDHQFVMWLGIAHCHRGWSSVADGDISGGIREIQLGLRIWEATGAKLPGTYLRRNLIDAELALGDIDAGLADVEQGLHQIQTTLESYQEPEYHRLKGELLKLSGDGPAAEREMRIALNGAREQGAAWVELRAALSLKRLAGQLQGADALSVLAEVCSRITEGAETAYVKEANAFLSGGDPAPIRFAL
jgi:class 3 adenylate cyclase/tetratricopeptide (TPR) repeat protein